MWNLTFVSFDIYLKKCCAYDPKMRHDNRKTSSNAQFFSGIKGKIWQKITEHQGTKPLSWHFPRDLGCRVTTKRPEGKPNFGIWWGTLAQKKPDGSRASSHLTLRKECKYRVFCHAWDNEASLWHLVGNIGPKYPYLAKNTTYNYFRHFRDFRAKYWQKENIWKYNTVLLLGCTLCMLVKCELS